MTYNELIESIKDHSSAEDWVYAYPRDIDSDGYSYFQDAAIEIAGIAYILGKRESFDKGVRIGYNDAIVDVTKGIVGKIYELANPLVMRDL